MELTITYDTKERKYHTENIFSFVRKTVTLAPTVIYRRPCGEGKASQRFYYSAKFAAPDDAEFAWDGFITENIDRKVNPHFDPKKLDWDKYKAVL